MPPAEVYVDFQEVIFKGPVLFATYGPIGAPPIDVTMKVRKLQLEGVTKVTGGIHTKLGDNFQGVPKEFRLFYTTMPSAEWSDGQNVDLTNAGLVLFASYGPANKPPIDVTDKVRELQSKGQLKLANGVHHFIGDPAPGQAKRFRVWTA